MKKSILVLFVFIVGLAPLTYSQSNTKDDVLLFQSFFRDASVHSNAYGQGLLSYSAADYVDVLGIGLQAGIPVTPEFELGTAINFLNRNYDIDGWDDDTGVADIPIYGRYNFMNEVNTKLSGGAFLTLPVGSEDIGGGNVDFGIFGAVRHAVSDPVVLTGTLGINFFEFGDSRETSLNFGGGVIYQANNDLNIIGELSLETEVDYAMLSGGIDYNIGNDLRLRSGLGLGLNDNAPDFQLFVGLLMHL